MTILGNGNVGIGTTSPGAKLDVNGSTYLDYMETSSWIYIKGASGSYMFLLHGVINGIKLEQDRLHG